MKRPCLEPSCHRAAVGRGMCTMHYQRWYKSGARAPRPGVYERDPVDRLLDQCVEDVDGCWVYQGALTPAGYVRIKVDGRMTLGHRATWTAFRGDVPSELTFDHLCRKPACVNPWHGDLVPLSINVRRATNCMGMVNAAKTHCPSGHPYAGDNLLWSGDGRTRRCRLCRDAANARRDAARKAARQAA